MSYDTPQHLSPRGHASMEQERPTSGMAVASLVLGITWVFWIGSILAVIFGHKALSDIRCTGADGKGLALAGVVLGWVGVATLTIWVLMLLLAAAGTTAA